MSTSSTPVVTRFAPSPTGELHVGGARTALFSWAYAKHHGGQFLLRFEDTDQKRSSKQAEQNILRDLQWLGLTADNQVPDANAIPRQSERLELYHAALAKLAAAGHTYEDNGAIRFKMGQDVSFTDAVYGDVTVPGADLEDFVIQKADGFPTFHLAVVVDDAAMNVTHVIRGQEHLANTPKHAALYDALGETRPVWCHTPSIMNPDGSKMSKRDKAKIARKTAQTADLTSADNVTPDDFAAFMAKDNDTLATAQAIAAQLNLALPEINVADFKSSGYTPAVLLNYLALLGWNPGDNVERFDLDFLSQHFDFDRIGKSNSKFDRDKLAAFSQDTILKSPAADWATQLETHFKNVPAFAPFIDKLGSHFFVFAAAYQERSKTLNDPATLGRFFVEAPTAYNAKAVKKNLAKNEGEGLKNLSALRDQLAATSDWTADKLHALIDAAWEPLGGKNMGAVAQPLRVALTGAAVSPEMGPTLALLGQQETLARIDACLKHHENAANS